MFHFLKRIIPIRIWNDFNPSWKEVEELLICAGLATALVWFALTLSPEALLGVFTTGALWVNATFRQNKR